MPEADIMTEPVENCDYLFRLRRFENMFVRDALAPAGVVTLCHRHMANYRAMARVEK